MSTSSSESARRVVEDLEAARTLPPDHRQAVMIRLAAAQVAVAASLQESPRSSGEADELLDVTEAAKKMGTTVDYLYRHARRLPFAVWLSPRQLRFSRAGIERYIAEQARMKGV